MTDRINVRIDHALKRRLQIRLAVLDETWQQWVTRMAVEEVVGIRLKWRGAELVTVELGTPVVNINQDDLSKLPDRRKS